MFAAIFHEVLDQNVAILVGFDRFSWEGTWFSFLGAECYDIRGTLGEVLVGEVAYVDLSFH